MPDTNYTLRIRETDTVAAEITADLGTDNGAIEALLRPIMLTVVGPRFAGTVDVWTSRTAHTGSPLITWTVGGCRVVTSTTLSRECRTPDGLRIVERD